MKDDESRLGAAEATSSKNLSQAAQGPQWTQDVERQGAWSRRLVAGEYFCYKAAARSIQISNREAVAIIAHVQIEASVPTYELTELLRTAWIQTRLDLPDLATTAESPGYRQYQVPQSQTDLDAWLDETFIVTDDISGQKPWFECPPSRHAVLYWIPTTCELVLYCSHWRLDGIGSLMVMQHILQLLVEPPKQIPTVGDFGLEPERLSPDLSLAFRTPEDDWPSVDKQGRQRCDALKGVEIDNSFKLTRIPGSESKLPARHQQTRLQFTIEESKQIFQRCCENGYSVTSAIHAAFVLALIITSNVEATTNDINSSFLALKRKSYTYASSGRVNFRPTLPPPCNTSAHASTLYVAIAPMTVPVNICSCSTEIYRETAKQFSISYRSMLEQVRNDPLAAPSMNNMMVHLADDLDGLAVVLALPYITSLGVVNKVLPSEYSSYVDGGSVSIKVKDFSFTSSHLGNSVAGYLFTFNDRLTLEAGYNETSYDKAVIERFLGNVRRIVVENLLSPE